MCSVGDGNKVGNVIPVRDQLYHCGVGAADGGGVELAMQASKRRQDREGRGRQSTKEMPSRGSTVNIAGKLSFARQEMMHRILMRAFLPVLAWPDDQLCGTAQPGLLLDERF